MARHGLLPAGGYSAFPAIEADPVSREPAIVGSCYPNPAIKEATLSFVLPAPARVNLTVFDLQGRRVRSPIANEPRPAGVQYAGIPVRGLPPGCYLCRLDIGGLVFTRKLVVLRG